MKYKTTLSALTLALMLSACGGGGGGGGETIAPASGAPELGSPIGQPESPAAADAGPQEAPEAGTQAPAQPEAPSSAPASTAWTELTAAQPIPQADTAGRDLEPVLAPPMPAQGTPTPLVQQTPEKLIKLVEPPKMPVPDAMPGQVTPNMPVSAKWESLSNKIPVGDTMHGAAVTVSRYAQQAEDAKRNLVAGNRETLVKGAVAVCRYVHSRERFTDLALSEWDAANNAAHEMMATCQVNHFDTFPDADLVQTVMTPLEFGFDRELNPQPAPAPTPDERGEVMQRIQGIIDITQAKQNVTTWTCERRKLDITLDLLNQRMDTWRNAPLDQIRFKIDLINDAGADRLAKTRETCPVK